MIYYKKAPVIDVNRRKFLAKVVADIGKTIFAVGLASYFFEKFPFSLKATLWSICAISLTASILIYPQREKGA
jgi:hypothetical protein